MGHRSRTSTLLSLATLLALTGCSDPAGSAPGGPGTGGPGETTPVPTIQFELRAPEGRSLADTVYGTAMPLRVAGLSGHRAVRVTHSLNGGPEEVLTQQRAGWTLSLTPPFAEPYDVYDLPEGRVEVRVFLYDSLGVRSQATATVQVRHLERRYAATFLGGSGRDSRILDLAAGRAVGYVLTADSVSIPVLWENGGRRDLPGPGRAVAVTHDGTVVVQRGTSGYTWKAGVLTPLDAACPGLPLGVSDAGEVFTTGTSDRPYRCQGATAMQLAVGTWNGAVVMDVNRNGRAVGYQRDLYYQPRVWEGTTVSSVGFGRHSYPVQVSDGGRIVGRGGHFGERSYLYDGAALADLTSVVGPSTAAAAVNDAREVVGMYGWSPRTPFLRAGGRTYVVRTDGEWRLGAVDRIDENGWLAAYGEDPQTGRKGALLLKPLP